MAVVRTAFLACCLFVQSPLASALDAGPGEDLFAQGVSAFQHDDFSAAADYFRQALAAGLDTSPLRYNLGASLYKLGRYRDAEDTFRALARDPAWSGLAYYNMALAAYARDARALARTYAEDARRDAEAGEVRALAAALLERLGAGRRSGRALVQLHLGHDSNVTLTADDQTLAATRRSDSFLQLQAMADGHFALAGETWRWDASLYSLDYRELSENDINKLQLGVSRPARYGDWRWEAGARLQYLWLDGHGLQQVATLRLEGTHPLGSEHELRAAARVSAIDTVDAAFDFLRGAREQLDISLGQSVAGGWVTTGVSWERNDRADLAMDPDFFSFSPTRQGAWLAGTWPALEAWRLEPFARYYHSRYADPELRAGEPARTRADDQMELSLRLRLRFAATWQLLLEYSYLDNDSNFAEFTYTQRLVLLGIARSL